MAGHVGPKPPRELVERISNERWEAPNKPPQVADMQETIAAHMPKPPSEYELRSITPEQLLDFYKGAIVSLSEMVDDMDHAISKSGAGSDEVHSLTYDVRAQVPGTVFWVERTANGKIW